MSAFIFGSILATVSAGSLVGIAILDAQETVQTIAVAALNPATGEVAYSAELDIPPSAAFCNSAFDADRGVYYVPSGVASILTVGIDGSLLNNATLSLAYDLPATQWDSRLGLLLALGMPGGAHVMFRIVGWRVSYFFAHSQARMSMRLLSM